MRGRRWFREHCNAVSCHPASERPGFRGFRFESVSAPAASGSGVTYVLDDTTQFCHSLAINDVAKDEKTVVMPLAQVLLRQDSHTSTPTIGGAEITAATAERTCVPSACVPRRSAGTCRDVRRALQLAWFRLAFASRFTTQGSLHRPS